jgi:DNA polymerase III subunit delta'
MAPAAVSTPASPIVGQTAVRRYLAECLRAGRSAHAYLLTGSRGIGKAAVAIEFARLLLCEDDDALAPCEICPQCLLSRSLRHPDLFLAFPLPAVRRKTKTSSLITSMDEEQKSRDGEGNKAEGDDPYFALSDRISRLITNLASDPYLYITLPKTRTDTGTSEQSKDDPKKRENLSIKIEQMRRILHQASLRPFQAKCKVFLIFEAGTMEEAAENAFLKTLEEPVSNTVFLLTTENENELRPTIRSRCQRVRMNRLARSEIAEALIGSGVTAEAAKIAAALAGGSFAHARELAAGGVQDLQNRVIAFLRAAAICDPLELTDASTKLMETGKLPEQSGLELLSIFLRDVALWHASQDGSDRLPFRDFQTHIVRLLSSFPHADFEAAVSAVDESARYLTKGYTQEFVLYALAIRLHDALGERATAKPSPQRAQHV